MREATRINQQRTILDKQIQEETRKEKYFQSKSRNKSIKTTGNVEKDVDVDDNEHMVSPVNLSSTFKPPLPFQSMSKLLDIPRTASVIPKLPTFLKSLSVSMSDQVGVTPEKSRRVEASILRIQSKT